MAATNWDKFLLLMWKNLLLQWRHKFRTAVEVLAPVIFSALLVLIRSLVDPEINSGPTRYPSVPINHLTELREIIANSSHQIDWRIVYTPNNSVYKELVDSSSDFLGLEWGVGVNSSDDLAIKLVTGQFLVGLVFHQDNVVELPNHLEYSIRFPSELRSGRFNPSTNNWRTDLLFPRFDILGPRNRRSDDGGIPPGYVREGFMTIQHTIADQYLRIKSNGISMPDIEVQRFPYPPHIRDVLLTGLESLVSLIILLSFVYPFTNTVKYIAVEKEKQLKEWMKIMGLPHWLHWTSWFVRTMILMTISMSLMVLLLKIPWYPNTSTTVFTYSDWSCLWVFLFVFCMATTTFSFMLSVFFSKANTASAVSGLIWFLCYVLYTFTSATYETLALYEKMLISLLSNTGMAFGFQIIIRLEGTSEGLQWNNFWRPVSVDDNISVGLIMIMLLVSTLLYLLIALYVEQIFPGEYGVPEPWYFPFTKSFWCGKRNPNDFDDCVTHENPKNFEDDPQDRHCGIKAINLRKVYGRNKVAVQRLSLNMFDDQILVLLGHNGAGKTSTMSMLTGMLTPTSGTAIINGKDIRKDIVGVRSSLGLCPQHNILFDELTVREHIIFFSKLKGLDDNAVDSEVEKYVKLIALEPKMNAMSKTLSGGMKRKLCVCIALCGGSKVVLLDEPTSGMDPASRRALWDVLRNEKKGRTVLLSTHFMDEADILGDRIAIMSNGELKSVGTSYFLKKTFGSGYHLICVKKSSCTSEKITALIQRYIPDVKVDSDVGTELSYLLPDADSKKFQEIFKELEDQSSELGVDSYGISLTTMEEVFMKVGSDRVNAVDNLMNSNGNESLSDVQDSEYGSNVKLDYAEEIPLYTGLLLLNSQIRALFKKKAIQFIRSWILMLIQIAIPILFISITVLSQRALGWFRDLPQLKIWLQSYLRSFTILETFSDVDDTALVERFASEYFNQIGVNDDHRFERISDKFEDYILGLSEMFLVRVNSQYFAGATIQSAHRIIAWFNNEAYHTAPLSLSLVHNAVLRAHLGADCQITVYNEPLPYSVQSRIEFLQTGGTMGFQMAVNIGFAMAFVASFYVLSYIKERETRSKLLQFVSGANVLTFWLTAYLWDFFTFAVTVLLLVITFGLFQENGWSSPVELSRILLVLVAFMFAILPITFVASKFFKEPADGFSILSLAFIVTGMACFFIIFIMSMEDFDLQNVAKTLTWIFLIFPHFALSQALSNLNMVTVFNQICDTQCQLLPGCTRELMCELLPQFNVTAPCCTNDYFDFDNYGIGRNLLYLIVIGILAFSTLLLNEYGLFATLFYTIKGCLRSFEPTQSDEFQDSDVVEEKERVKAMSTSEIENHNLVVSGISKFYGNFMAVNEMFVAVEQSECFGLLGVNGAGKTSAFKMLTGDEIISSGEGWIRGLSLKTQMNEIHKIIGYCPQFDALIADMTGRETLEMFCLLRGVPNRRIKALSMQLAVDLNFVKHIDKRVKEYSGGSKRKLSTAVALIGNPAIVYFDEPTTGMDPGAKRQLWDMVSKIRKTGKSIILTSHSMDECEALCTRLAIMVNGEFKCLGSVQHLKNKFSQGFNISIKIRKIHPQPNGGVNGEWREHKTSGQMITEIKDFVDGNFKGAILKEEYQGLLTYFVPKFDLKWSEMFGLMEEAKSKFNIEDYSLSQTSLEQVFLSFAQLQKEEKINQGS